MSSADDDDVPFVLRDMTDEWLLPGLELDTLSDMLGEQISTRFTPRVHYNGEIAWETVSAIAKCSVHGLLKWMASENDSKSVAGGRRRKRKRVNPPEITARPRTESRPSTATRHLFDSASSSHSTIVAPDKYWCYAGYYHLNQMSTRENVAAIVDWSVFGVAHGLRESTIWIGSAGAYTPCHYDTMGFNLHAQFRGTKRWILFPPTDSKFLRPSRMPFEETSVFRCIFLPILYPPSYSHVDILGLPGQLRQCRPYIVDVQPGEVIYVPPKWWHFVQCLSSPTISVNTWVPIAADAATLLEEAHAAVILSTMVNGTKDDRLIDMADVADLDDDGHLKHSSAIAAYMRVKYAASHPTADGVPPTPTDDVHDAFVAKFRPQGHRIVRSSFHKLEKKVNDSLQRCDIKRGHKEEGEEDHHDGYGGLKGAMARAIFHPDVTKLMCRLVAEDSGWNEEEAFNRSQDDGESDEGDKETID